MARWGAIVVGRQQREMTEPGSIPVGSGEISGSLTWVSGQSNTLESYFSNYGICGIFPAAYYQPAERREAADALYGCGISWLQYFRKHLNDGDGLAWHMHRANWTEPWARSTARQNPDAQDSCPATYLAALWQAWRFARNDEDRAAVMELDDVTSDSVALLKSVVIDRGITIAKPWWWDHEAEPDMYRTTGLPHYLQDNIETWLGWVSYVRYATARGWRTEAQWARHQAARTRYFIQEGFINPVQGEVTHAVESGYRQLIPEEDNLWYPHALSVAMLCSIVGDPDRNYWLWDRAASITLDVDRDDTPTGSGALNTMTWWLMAAKRMGDTARYEKALALIPTTTSPLDPFVVDYMTQACGRMMQLNMEFDDSDLWF